MTDSTTLSLTVLAELEAARLNGRGILADAARAALLAFANTAARQRDTLVKAQRVATDVEGEMQDGAQYQLRSVLREFEGFDIQLQRAAARFDREQFPGCAEECRRLRRYATEACEVVRSLLRELSGESIS